MLLQIMDFNGAGAVINRSYQQEWCQLEAVLSAMPLHLKASDQAGIQGRPNFDVVGTNEYIENQLTSPHLGWASKIPVPQDIAFLGTDVDFAKNGVLVEVQFSNYPFLLNNTLRSDLFYRYRTVFHRAPTEVAIIVTKAGMFPSANSTLYFEQAVEQLRALAHHNIFSVPIRLVGLFEQIGRVSATWTEYSAARYSRTVGIRNQRPFVITNGRSGRCRIDPV